jgi:hypothetical protein
MKNRKAFNFYRSYYDVVVELTDEQKVQFLMAILNKQFLDVEPELDGLVGLLYKSQKHSIDAQVEGYKSKMKITTPSTPPSVPPTQGPTEPPSVQEQGQGKGQVEEQVYEKNDFDKAKTKSLLCRELNITSTQFNRYIVEGNINEYHNQKLLKQYENEINRYWN